jgi:hypothetical protein
MRCFERARLSQLAEKCAVLKGHGFSHAANTRKLIAALAAEGRFSI